MSKKEKAVIKCNNCDNQFDTEIWTKINVEDQELEHKLFTDQINVFECSECGNRGFVCYPIKITDKRVDECAIAIPLNKIMSIDDYDEEDYDEIHPAFLVVELKKRKPWKVSYNLNELKFEIYKWSGEPFTPYGGPPEEEEIEEGLRKGIINKKEAEKLRTADWELIDEKMLVEGIIEKEPVDFDDEQNEVLDLYFRLMLELDRSRKVVSIGKR